MNLQWTVAVMLVLLAAAVVTIVVMGVSLGRAWRVEGVALESSQRLTLATEATAIGVWDWELSTGRWWATPTYFAMLGYRPGEGIGSRQEWLASVHQDDRRLVEEQIRGALEGADSPYQHDVRVRHKDGAFRWVRIVGRVLSHDERGRASRFLGVMTDITSAKQSELLLRESESFSLSILDSVTAEIAVLDAHGVILAVNEPWKRFALENARVSIPEPGPRASAAHVGVSYFAACEDGQGSHGDGSRARAGIQSVLDGPLSDFQMEYDCHSLTEKRWYLMNVTPLGSSRKGVVVAHINITARRRAEDALRLSLHEKEALLKEVHHRVKNNLQVITSLLRLESSRTREPGTRGVLQEMQGRIRAMALLHETLYRTGRFARVDLAEYLGKLATQLFRAQNVAPGAVALGLALRPVTVSIDRAIPCGLIVNELLSNCLKHGFADGRSGEVRLSLQAAAGRIDLTVSDDGAGLPDDFETRRGAALGLQMVGDLARQLGGALEIGPGPATAFSVRFTSDEGLGPT